MWRFNEIADIIISHFWIIYV